MIRAIDVFLWSVFILWVGAVLYTIIPKGRQSKVKRLKYEQKNINTSMFCPVCKKDTETIQILLERDYLMFRKSSGLEVYICAECGVMRVGIEEKEIVIYS
jgi:transcription elongation factor Elf1